MRVRHFDIWIRVRYLSVITICQVQSHLLHCVTAQSHENKDGNIQEKEALKSNGRTNEHKHLI